MLLIEMSSIKPIKMHTRPITHEIIMRYKSSEKLNQL